MPIKNLFYFPKTKNFRFWEIEMQCYKMNCNAVQLGEISIKKMFLKVSLPKNKKILILGNESFMMLILLDGVGVKDYETD